MNIKKAGLWSVLGGFAVLLGIAIVGCEVEPAGARIYVSPGSATVRKYATVRLTAAGGFDYEWSLDNEEWGTLSSRRGRTVVYKSRFAPEDCNEDCDTADFVQTVRVSSFINNAGGAESNFVSNAEALLKHVGFGLQIVPSQATVRKGESVLFRATGGEDYVWELQQDSASDFDGSIFDWGTLNTRTGPNVWYTSLYDPSESSAGNPQDLQYIQVRSSDGGQARAWISHMPSGSQLGISPAGTTTLDTIGKSVTYTATGGDEYRWSLSSNQYVDFTKSPPTGRTITVVYLNPIPVVVNPDPDAEDIIVQVEARSGSEVVRAYLILQ